MPTAQFLGLSVLNVTDIQQFQNVLHLEQQKDVHSQHRLSFHPLLATEEIWLGLKAEFLRALPRSTTSSRSSRYRDGYIPSSPWVEQRNCCGCIKPTGLPTNLVEARHQLRFSEDTARWDLLSFPVQKGAFTEMRGLPTASRCCTGMRYRGTCTYLSLHLFGLDAFDFCKSFQVFFHR